MDKLFDDSDLADLLTELNQNANVEKIEDNKEMEAAQRRYDEIIKKHKDEV
ncbi:MAG: hypothetical protein PWP24_175 [Clostridiales bacterium]|nr:hypothetical protein [Clostridiales bacterium]